MSEDDETYCRLCAEPTPLTQLIQPDEDVAVNGKIITKLSWINIDLTSSVLPNTICFSCFDLLERTWKFLNNTRIAHEKLTSIFVKVKDSTRNTDKKEIPETVPGKPIDLDWECFQEQKIKVEIKDDNSKPDIVELDNVSCKLDVISVKSEQCSDFDFNPDDQESLDHESSDSDVPLEITAKKKRTRHKRLKETPQIDVKAEIVQPLDVLSVNIQTWENQACRCAKCDAQCKNILSLQIHSLQIHDHCCVFKCLECAKVFNNFQAFIRHMRTHYNSLNHCCEYCFKLFLLPSELKYHRVKEHTGAFTKKCRLCGSNFETPEELQEHELLYSKRYRRQPKTSDWEQDLKCPDCDKVFKSRSNLQQHKLVHTERSRDFSCHVCGKMFFTKGTLSTHMQTHEDTKPYKCNFCSLAFRARGNLISHITLHSPSKPFVCEQCGKTFRVKRHLKSHSIVHTDLMPYVCEYCNKTFRFKTRLNLHLRQHTGAKPYTCIYCARDFTNGSNHKKHMKRRHGIETTRKKYNIVVANKEESDMNDSMSATVFAE